MAEQIGSMEIVGTYRDAGLQRGLRGTKQRLQKTKESAQNLDVSFQRMRGTTMALAGAAGLAGGSLVSMFTQAAASSPYLAGHLNKIGTELKLLGWKSTKWAAPGLELVGEAVENMRKKDWDGLNKNIEEMGFGFAKLMKEGKPFGGWLENLSSTLHEEYFGDWTLDWDEMKQNWIDILSGIDSWLRDKGGFIKDTIGGWFDSAWTYVTKDLPKSLGNIYNNIKSTLAGWAGSIKNTIKDWFDVDVIGIARSLISDFRRTIDRYMPSFLKRDIGSEVVPPSRKRQTGGYVPQTGLYQLHSGETVVPKGRNTNDSDSANTNITVSFDGANISLAEGIDLENLADSVSRAIADKQRWEAF